MPKELYDVDGNPIQAFTPEEIAEKEKELETTKTELEKLKNKDFNFKKLRDMNEEEKAKLTGVELQLKQKQEELEENQKTFSQQIVDGNKNEALAVLVGDDEELRKKVLSNYDRIKGDAVTKEEINSRMREAYNMLGQFASKPNPLLQAVNFSGGAGVVKTPSKLNDDQKSLGKKLGLTDEDLKDK